MKRIEVVKKEIEELKRKVKELENSGILQEGVEYDIVTAIYLDELARILQKYFGIRRSKKYKIKLDKSG